MFVFLCPEFQLIPSQFAYLMGIGSQLCSLNLICLLFCTRKKTQHNKHKTRQDKLAENCFWVVVPHRQCFYNSNNKWFTLWKSKELFQKKWKWEVLWLRSSLIFSVFFLSCFLSPCPLLRNLSRCLEDWFQKSNCSMINWSKFNRTVCIVGVFFCVCIH